MHPTREKMNTHIYTALRVWRDSTGKQSSRAFCIFDEFPMARQITIFKSVAIDFHNVIKARFSIFMSHHWENRKSKF